MKNFELDEGLAEDANRLIKIKKSIAELQEEEKLIKNKLEPYIELIDQLLMPEGRIYCHAQKMARTFKRSDVLEFIEERYGIEAALALDIKCTRKKLIAQRLHVKTWENKK